MKISIITVCFNSAETIKDTIKSIASQDYPDIEHIIIDGGSSDGTLDIIASASSVNRYISEPDAGIYDAMNKGLAMATGEVIGILNADDMYAQVNVISRIAAVFEDESVDACYADLVYVKQHNTTKIVRYWKSNPFRTGTFKNGWMPPHPTFFARRKVYESYGKFDLNYSIAADVELLFRFLEIHKIKSEYLPSVLIMMRLGGTTNKSFENIKKQNKEVLHVLDNHYSKVSRMRFFAGKLLNRAMQFVFRP